VEKRRSKKKRKSSLSTKKSKTAPRQQINLDDLSESLAHLVLVTCEEGFGTPGFQMSSLTSGMAKVAKSLHALLGTSDEFARTLKGEEKVAFLKATEEIKSKLVKQLSDAVHLLKTDPTETTSLLYTNIYLLTSFLLILHLRTSLARLGKLYWIIYTSVEHVKKEELLHTLQSTVISTRKLVHSVKEKVVEEQEMQKVDSLISATILSLVKVDPLSFLSYYLFFFSVYFIHFGLYFLSHQRLSATCALQLQLGCRSIL